MATVLVTGGSGFVGSHALPPLLQEGHRVRALVRTDEAGRAILARLDPGVRSSVELVRGDVVGPAPAEQLSAALAGADAVVHLVAIARDWNGGRDLQRVNVGGTRNLLAAMEAAGVRRLIHLGAMGVVDDPHLHYASSKARAEAACASSGLDVTILKPSLLWGERDGFFNIIAGLVRTSPVVVPMAGSGRSRFQPLWVDDLARVIVACLVRPETIDRTYELGGPRFWTYREIVMEVASALGKRRTPVPVPVSLIAGVARVAEAVRLPFPVASDQLRQLALDNVGPLDTIPASFGFEARDMAGNLGYLRRRAADQ